MNIDLHLNQGIHPLTTLNTPPPDKPFSGSKELFVGSTFIRRMRNEMQIDQEYKYQDLR